MMWKRILKLRCAGLPLKAIADEVSRSYKTIQWHWLNITKRAGSSDPVMVYRWAVSKRLVWSKATAVEVKCASCRKPFYRTDPRMIYCRRTCAVNEAVKRFRAKAVIAAILICCSSFAQSPPPPPTFSFETNRTTLAPQQTEVIIRHTNRPPPITNVTVIWTSSAPRQVLESTTNFYQWTVKTNLTNWWVGHGNSLWPSNLYWTTVVTNSRPSEYFRVGASR